MIGSFSNGGAESVSIKLKHRSQMTDAAARLKETANAKNANEVDKYNQKIRDAADSFEELFVHKMIKVMRESNTKGNMMDGGHGEEIFQDMLDEKYAGLFTSTKALGMSDMIYENTKIDKKTKLATGLGKY